jgi:hypothetical protein
MTVAIRLIAFFVTLSGIATAAPFTTHVAEGPVRVFYTLEGKDAVPDKDGNGNGIPYHVEDVAVQSFAAYELFIKVLDFPDPLKSERYKDVDFIDIVLRHTDAISGMKGLAFDEIQKVGRSIDPPGTTQLTIGIAISVKAPSNPTPAHEIFHLIQYGATYFKNGWFQEGQARWAEHSLRKGGIGEYRYSPKGPWPQTTEARKQLFGMTYDSEYYIWNPLAIKSDRSGVIPRRTIPFVLRKRTYTNGQPVLEDLQLHGYKVMRSILHELGAADDIAARELSYEKWSEANQKSERNNQYVYDAIMKAARIPASRRR